MFLIAPLVAFAIVYSIEICCEARFCLGSLPRFSTHCKSAFDLRLAARMAPFLEVSSEVDARTACATIL